MRHLRLEQPLSPALGQDGVDEIVVQRTPEITERVIDRRRLVYRFSRRSTTNELTSSAGSTLLPAVIRMATTYMNLAAAANVVP